MSNKSITDLRNSNFKLEKPQLPLRFLFGLFETSLALRYSKQLDREHNARAFTGAIATARDCRHHCEGGRLSNLEKLISYSLKILENFSEIWASSDLEKKRRFHKLLFPDGV